MKLLSMLFIGSLFVSFSCNNSMDNSENEANDEFGEAETSFIEINGSEKTDTVGSIHEVTTEIVSESKDLNNELDKLINEI